MTSQPAGSRAFDWLEERAAQRRRRGLRREQRIRNQDDKLIDVAGNDYLGLSRHPDVRRAAADAAAMWGVGATGSRLVRGTTALHEGLEEALAEFCGAEAALVFSSGYLANLGVVTALCAPDSLIVADRHIHASLIDACHLARGEVVYSRHNDVENMASHLNATSRGRALIATESVFSVDGDLASLADIADVARNFNAGVIVDDAHGFGVVGPGGVGAVAAAGLVGDSDVVTTLTLSKALGAQGGVVLGSQAVIDHLVDSARAFIYDTALAPPVVGAALTALHVLKREPELATRVRWVAIRLQHELTAAGLPTRPSEGAIVSIDAPTPTAAVKWAAACLDDGVAVGCFRPPSVPDRISRLRLTAHAHHTDAEIDRVIEVVTRHAPAQKEN